jgi:hypothetical protein
MDSVSIAHYNAMTRWTISVCLVTGATAVLPAFQTCRVLRRQEQQMIDLAALRAVPLRFTNARKLVTVPYLSHFNDVIQPDPCSPQAGGRTVLWVVSRLYGEISY